MSDFLEALVQAVVLLILIGFIISGILIICSEQDNKLRSEQDNKQWNNGYCECGGKWEYQQAVGHRYDTDYIYKCNKCGKIEEFDVAR